MAFIYDLTDTWNAGGTTFNAIKMNVTDSASAAGSKLVTLQVGGVERFGVDKGGVGTFASAIRAATGSTSAPAFSFTSDTNTGMWSPAADTLALSTAGTERMRITSAGNVGIGTSSPSQLLHVQSTSGAAGSAVARLAVSGTAALEVGQEFFSTPTDSTTSLRSGRIYSKFDGISYADARLSFQSMTSGNTLVDTMHLKGGNVGIGTSSPGSFGRFAVVGSAGGAGILALNTDATRADIQSYNVPLAINRQGNNTLLNEGGGNVGIGTSSPGYRLQINDPGTGMGLTNAAGGNLNIGLLGGVANGTAWVFNRANTALIFGTNNAERMRITAAGIVRPGADNTQSFGEASYRWSTVFAGTGTINTSDEREKVWRGAMSEAEMRAAKRLLGELGMFQFTDSVEEKGEDARLHFGVRAQRAFAILEDEGLEWWRYAWCCHDEWDEITEPVMEEVTVEKTRTVEVPEEREVEKTETVMEPVLDEETGEQVLDEAGQPVMAEIEQTFTVTETVMVEIEETYEETEQRDTGEVRIVREAGDRYGIRADQLAYWLIAAQAEIQADLDARLAALEGQQA